MLTVAEAAKRAGRDPETIRRWIRSGRLPAWKAGGQHMIDDAALEDALRPVPVGDSTGSGARPHRVGESAIAYETGNAGSVPDAFGSAGEAVDVRLPHAVGRIVHGFDPSRIVLFGPRAHGASHADAEYKLLVILDEVADPIALPGAIRLSFADLPLFAQVLVTTSSDADVGGTLGGLRYWALREGVTIYSRDAAS